MKRSNAPKEAEASMKPVFAAAKKATQPATAKSAVGRESKWIWMDGAFVPFADAKIHVLAHGLNYGTGVFDGTRVYETPRGPAILRLDQRIKRLYRSARYLYLKIPYSPEELTKACIETVSRNDLGACYLRPMAFYGLGGQGFALRDNPVHTVIAVWTWKTFLGNDIVQKGARLKTVSWIKTPTNALPSLAKAFGNYINSLVSHQEAVQAGYDEGLLLNDRGTVAEASAENIFVVVDGEIWTPPISDHMLPGITRDTIMRLARDLGYKVTERSITRPELFDTEEMFMTGTASEVTPIREVDGIPIGAGKPGPITTRLQQQFNDMATGKLPKYQDWLTVVPRLTKAIA